MATLREQLLRRKPVAAMTEETGTDTSEGELSRSIGLFQLSAFGIGATIGTGIFIVLTEAVPIGGPGVILSFVFAGTVAASPRSATPNRRSAGGATRARVGHWPREVGRSRQPSRRD